MNRTNAKHLGMASSSAIGIASFLCFVVPAIADAEVSFPNSRNSVGADEFYLLDTFSGWDVYCLRDKNSEDACLASKLIADHAVGVELNFSVTPLNDYTESINVTVDISPRSLLAIEPISEADHYNQITASITELDGVFFDGYSCPVKNLDICDQGPDLVLQDIRSLRSAETALVEIRRVGVDDALTKIQVDLAGFDEAYRSANSFTADVLGIDLTDTRSIGEMCNFIHSGTERRISFFLDDEASFSIPSGRESWFGPVGTTNCPSYVILSYFTPDMTPAQRKHLCLNYDEENGEYLGATLGTGNHYRVCAQPTRTVCERINDSKDVAIAAVGAVGALVGSGTVATTATGVSVVAHSSGMAILTGGSGYIAGTIGPIATALGFLTSPVLFAGAAVSVVAVGGAVYVCAEPAEME